MQIIEIEIEKILKDIIEKAYPEIDNWDSLAIAKTKDPKFGDFQTNFAMISAKKLKNNPRKIAENIVGKFYENGVIKSLEIAGPGFINIRLEDSYLSNYIKETKKENIQYDFLDRDGEIIIDYSSPNVAKRMHIGHLRSTVIGDSIKRIYQFLGYNLVADNHIGDWGTQFGKLIVGYNRWLDKEKYNQNPIEELERLYQKFSIESEKDETLDDEARLELKKLQQSDPENKRLWDEFIKVSLDEYDKIYKRLDIEFDTINGESFYHDMMPDVINELEEKNILQEDEGAKLVYFEDEDNLHPCIVQKRDGSYLYSTSDLACLKYRKENYNLNKIIYVTDERQQTHFKQFFKISEMLGWDIEKLHIYFGIMKFSNEILSSRKGNVIRLEDLIEEGKTRARAVIEEKNPTLPEDEKEDISEKVAIGAIKYSDLSQNRVSDIIFDWDKMLSFEGNTAPYLQYSYARIQSIKRKAKELSKELDYSKDIIITSDTERALLLTLTQFWRIVVKAAEANKPNLITDYLFELAQKFNTFYNSMPILKAGDDILHSRLLIADKTAYIIGLGLNLLGIKTLDRM